MASMSLASICTANSLDKLQNGRKGPRVRPNPASGYFENIEDIRRAEYPQLNGTTYLDHAGTTPYASTLIERYSLELTSSLWGNPHSGSTASLLTADRIDQARLSVLRHFDASPDDYDVVFVANTSAAVRLVAEAFRDTDDGFWYGYHYTSHTSLIGVRELAAQGRRCYHSDDEVQQWINGLQSAHDPQTLKLFAYPGQSNMTGERLPLDWCRMIRENSSQNGNCVYTLLDVAALASTAPLSLADVASAPDFTCLSFYKIFGFPDLGALIVKRASAGVLLGKKYFAGGTVDMVTVGKLGASVRKTSIHEALEEGTLPFHDIVALGHALQVHRELYGSMHNISKHCAYLANRARAFLRDARHANGRAVCTVHGVSDSTQIGPVIAFNLRNHEGRDISPSEVEKLANVQQIQLRTGGLCNPGGISSHLRLSDQEQFNNYARGHRCNGADDLVNGKAISAIRISFGACSSETDLDNFIRFIEVYYIDRGLPDIQIEAPPTSRFYIESMSVFPIKSCAAFQIPPNISWPAFPTGLAFDREWCLVHAGTGVAMTQKRFPRMALLQPTIDLHRRKLSITIKDTPDLPPLDIDLEPPTNPSTYHSTLSTCTAATFQNHRSSVCGTDVNVCFYTSPTINEYFSTALGVPCTLARFPSSSSSSSSSSPQNPSVPRYSDLHPPTSNPTQTPPALKLSNESPFLLISRSSVNRLNEDIKSYNPTTTSPTRPRHGSKRKAVPVDCFRGNIVIAEHSLPGQCHSESPFAEESWTGLRIESSRSSTSASESETEIEATGEAEDLPASERGFEMRVLGPCQRCQIVCVDQGSGQRNMEPFSTLARTRKRDGKVWFGVHLALGRGGEAEKEGAGCGGNGVSFRVGDAVIPQM